MSEVPAPDGPSEAARRKARKVATIVFLTIVSVWVVVTTTQLVQQAHFPVLVPSPYGTCTEGLRKLHGAIDRARHVAEGDLDPDSALARYRTALDPEWTYLTGVRKTCGTAPERRSLDALERLRYAEEHAVRREAASLAALRRQVASDLAPR